jgi:hypothetical protein
MTQDDLGHWLIELILLGFLLLAGPLAGIVANCATEETAEEKKQLYLTCRSMLRILFAALLFLSVLLFKLLPLENLTF